MNIEEFKDSMAVFYKEFMKSGPKPTKEDVDKFQQAQLEHFVEFMRTTRAPISPEPPQIQIRPISFDRISEEDKAARRVPLEIIGTEKADLP